MLILSLFLSFISLFISESAPETSVSDLPLPCRSFSCCFLFYMENWLLATLAHTLALIASSLQGLKALIKASN